MPKTAENRWFARAARNCARPLAATGKAAGVSERLKKNRSSASGQTVLTP